MNLPTDITKIILLSDMDGTLLDSASTPSEENKDAIRRFIELGGNFGIATGRGHLNALDFLEGVTINTPSIVYNGSMLYDFKETKVSVVKTLPADALQDFLHWVMENFKEVMIHVYGMDICHIITPEEDADLETLREHQPTTFSNLQDILGEPWVKLLFSGKNQNLLLLEEHLKGSHLDGIARWVFSADIYLEVLPSSVSKGTMLTELRRIYGKDYKIVAMGDFYNDIEMLREADFGFATQNAPEEVKNASDRVTVSNDESAVAEVIKEILDNKVFGADRVKGSR